MIIRQERMRILSENFYIEKSRLEYYLFKQNERCQLYEMVANIDGSRINRLLNDYL